jgi:tetratricopeptide (TPR) repeat protein
MKSLIFISFFLLVYSCNTEQKSRRRIESLQNSNSTEKYEIGIACMRYISQQGNDFNYSKSLVKKLLALGFFAESINAVEMLQVNFPRDPELFYLKALGYHNLLQYGLAVENLNRALKLQPENKEFLNAVISVSDEKNIWSEIQTLNDSLSYVSDSFGILLNRAEKLFSIRQYDAVLYDLGSISKMGSANDSIYFANSVSSIYQDGGRKSVQVLKDMFGYFRTVEDEQNYSGK